MKITYRQLRRIIREAWQDEVGPMPPAPGEPGDPHSRNEWEARAMAAERSDLDAEKSAFLAAEQARWEDHWGIDEDDEAQQIRDILSKAYDDIEQWAW